MNGNQASDRQFWLDVAQESCAFFNHTVHPITGLNPDYSEFSGVAKGDTYGDTGTHDDFHYDAGQWTMPGVRRIQMK